MKKNKKKGSANNPAMRIPTNDNKTEHSKNGVGLPEDIRVVYSEENNPHDG